MYEDQQYPTALRDTPLCATSDPTYTLIDPTTGEEHTLKDTSVRQSAHIADLCRILQTACTYGELIDRITALACHKGVILHRLIENEDGMFSVGVLVPIASGSRSPLSFATSIPVPFDAQALEEVYLESEKEEVDAYAMIAQMTMRSMAMMAQTANMELLPVRQFLSQQWETLQSINPQRWAGIRCELLAGIPAVIVMRRWGVINTEGVCQNAVNEFEQFYMTVHQLKEA